MSYDQTTADLLREVSTLRASNAELAGALRKLTERLRACHNDARYMAVWESWRVHGNQYAGPFYVDELEHAEEVLARHAAGEPAKHPDTVRLDWLEASPYENLAEVRFRLWRGGDSCSVIRSAIDAARKEGRVQP